jgi:c-di-GMP-binding flagellar brake protein YcgR
MKMLVAEDLVLGTKLKVRFCLPRDREFISCSSEVVWARPGETAGAYRIGIRFLDISQRDADRVWGFVTQHCALPEQKEAT